MDLKAEIDLINWCPQWYAKHGLACFTKKLHVATNGRFQKYDNRSLSKKMAHVWKELGASTDGFVSPTAAAPSAKELMAKSRKGGKLGMEVDDDEGK